MIGVDQGGWDQVAEVDWVIGVYRVVGVDRVRWLGSNLIIGVNRVTGINQLIGFVGSIRSLGSIGLLGSLKLTGSTGSTSVVFVLTSRFLRLLLAVDLLVVLEQQVGADAWLNAYNHPVSVFCALVKRPLHRHMVQSLESGAA